MDDLRAAGLDAARKRVAPAPGAAAAAADVRAWRSSWPQRIGGAGDRRCALPPRPPPPPPRQDAGKPGDDAGGDSGGAAGSGASARAGPGAAGGNARAAVTGGDDASLVVARWEGSGSAEVGSKKRMVSASSTAVPRAYPPPKRKMVSADDGSRLVASPARPGAGSDASPTKPAAAPPLSVGETGSGGVLEKVPSAGDGSRLVVPPARRGLVPTKPAAAAPRSVAEAGSGGVLKNNVSAAVVPRPIADAGCHGSHAAALKPLEPSRRSGVAAADGLLDTDSHGRSGSGGFGSGKEVVRLPPKPRVISAIRLNKSADKCPNTESNGSSTASRSFGPKKKLIVRGLNHRQLKAKSADKCRKTESKDSSTASSSVGPNKKLTVKDPAHFRLRVASACIMGSISAVDDLVAAILADDAFLEAEAAYQRKLQLELYGSSDARSKVIMICRRFKFICDAIVQFVKQCSLKISRIDIAAGKVIKKLPRFTQQGPVIGNVPGVEVGDEFVYRVQLALVGLHRPHRHGIDSIRDENDELIAISIVASGGYPDELSSSGELIYTGSGGKYAGKKSDENQKLKGGNLALKNCIRTKTPVRVIYGVKGSSKEEGSRSRSKGASAFTYDGLYRVVDYWEEGQAGSKVFKYKLLRISDQPELPHRSKTASSRKTGIMC